jgi:hypothetical protein
MLVAECSFNFSAHASDANLIVLCAPSVPAGSLLVAECSFNFSEQMEEPELEDFKLIIRMWYITVCVALVPAGSMLVAECSFNFSAQMEEPELEDLSEEVINCM